LKKFFILGIFASLAVVVITTVITYSHAYVVSPANVKIAHSENSLISVKEKVKDEPVNFEENKQEGTKVYSITNNTNRRIDYFEINFIPVNERLEVTVTPNQGSMYAGETVDIELNYHGPWGPKEKENVGFELLAEWEQGHAEIGLGELEIKLVSNHNN